MNRVIGVRFKRAEKLCYCDPGEMELHRDNYVIVQMEKGQELGWIVKEPNDLVYSDLQEPLKPVIRKATSLDLQRRDELKAKEENALRTARGMVRELGLPFKMIETHFTFDGGRAILAFSSENRVDFRQLIRQLSTSLQCKVELRQVGSRDEAKLIGGIGRCGRALCCSTWLTEFSSVTVRMAKEQALPISAEGLAGLCGRLRCCLKYEYEQYRVINRTLPKIGERVDTPFGEARVLVGHRLRETVSVLYDDEAVKELPLAEITRFAASRN